MPSEPLNWDRKDFYKERRYERSDGGSVGGGGSSVGRWRDSRHGSRGYARWRTHEFHRHPGHGKQGGYQPSLEETGHGCRLSRSSDRMVEEESCRPSNNWNDRNFGRNNRERRGPGSQSEWQGSRFESGDISANSSGRHHAIIPQRSVSDQLTYLYQQPSDYGNNLNLSSEQINSKNLPDKLGGGFEGFGTGRRYNKDSSAIPWKSLKWTRSNSLSSPSSGFNHSSSSKSFREDLDENKPKSLPGKLASVQSPSEYAAGDLTYAESYEEMCARKKQRVGWGQGLAKFEKKKVGDSDDTTTKNGLVLPASNTNASHSLAPNLPHRSPNATASPATPSSMSCSSSPGAEYFSYSKVMSDKNDTSYYSPDQGFQNLQGDSDKVEHFELDPTTDLSSSAISLLQPENASSVDSSFVTINKLLLLKNDVLKALEKTESELELYENKLKALNSETVTGGQYPTASESPPEDCTSKICQEATSASKELQKHSPLQSVSSVNMLVETPTVCNETLSGFGADVKDGYVDSPVISTSVGRFISSSSVLKHDECMVATSTSSKERLPMFNEKLGVSIEDKNHINESSTSAVELRGPSNSECVLNVSILESNRSSAKKASEIFSKLLPTDPNQIDIWKNISLSCQQNVSLIKEKLAIRKCFMRFKKRVLTLKFKAHRHLWKEDLRLLSIKKNRAKPQKRFESGLKTSNNGSQKHGSSVRSRFTSPGKFGLVPTTEIVDFTSKLLSDSKFKLCRSTLKIPSLILDKRERNITRFVTSNGLVEDPCAVEKERVMINPWMPEEKEIFMEMLTTYGKDFKKIASFLDHKTTADCVEFYYKNHKSESFDKIKKKLEVRKQGRSFPTNTYLMTSRKEWKPEVNAASLDILGAASMIAANADATMKSQQNCAGMSLLGRYYDYKVLQPKDGLLECSSSTDMIGNGTASAGICGAPSSETTRSNFTSSVDHGEVCQVLKNQKRNCITDQPLTPVTHNIDEEETCSDESSEEMDSIDWNDEEKSLFIKSLRSNGKDFVKISQCIGSKSSDQCKVFFSKARKCLGLELMDLVLGEGTAVNDIDVGQMDKKETWVGEIGSPILGTQFCDKMDVDASSSVSNSSDKASSCAEITLTEEDRSEGNKKTEQSDCDDPRNGEFISEGEKNLVQNVEGKLSATAGALHCDDAVTAKAALSCEMPLQLNGSPRLNFDTTAVKEQQDGQKVTPEEFLSSVSPVEHDRSCSSAGVELKAVLGAYTEEITESDKQDANGGADKNLYRSSSYSVPHSNTPSNVTRLVEETSVPSGFGLTPNYPSQIFLEVLPGVEKSQIISWQQAESSSMPSNPVVVDSSTSHFEERLHCATASTFNFETYKDMYDQKSSGQDATQKHLLGHESLSRSASLQNFRGYPQMSKNKEVNMDADSISREKHTIVQYYSRANRNSQSNQRSVQNYSLEKCNGSKLHSVVEFSLQPKSQEHSSSDIRRAHSWSSSDTVEHSKKTADVKLFGQILSPFPPSQSPVPSMNGSFSTTTESSSKSFNLKLADHGRGGTLVPPKLNPSNLSGSDSLPVRSYGYWEGNRIQAGLSSLPDPMVSLTEFPAAVIGGSSSSCGIDKLKINDRNFGCMSAKDQGLIGYPMYGSYEGTKTQPFPVVDVKQHVVFSELQKHNGFEAEPSFTGISDPVAAIKMHYATAEKYGGQGQNGTGDIGS